jgi:hypothetical protein
MTKPKGQTRSKWENPNDKRNPNASVPKKRLLFNFPLEVRGIKGVISIVFITPLSPLTLRGGDAG